MQHCVWSTNDGEEYMQLYIILSVKKLYLSATSYVQYILYALHVLESLGLKVKKPMILWIDNKGAFDVSNC